MVQRMRRLRATRWGDNAPGGETEARERLLDAAEGCFERWGVVKTTMDDVAALAKVSRATVYRYFAGRDDLVLAVVMRRAADFYDRLQEVVERAPTFADGIADGVAYSVGAVRRDRYLSFVFAPGDAPVASGALAASSENRRFNEAGLRPLLEDARVRGELRPDLEVEEVADWLLRVVLLILTLPPAEQDEAVVRRFVRRLVVPALVTPSAGGAGRG